MSSRDARGRLMVSEPRLELVKPGGESRRRYHHRIEHRGDPLERERDALRVCLGHLHPRGQWFVAEPVREHDVLTGREGGIIRNRPFSAVTTRIVEPRMETVAPASGTSAVSVVTTPSIAARLGFCRVLLSCAPAACTARHRRASVATPERVGCTQRVQMAMRPHILSLAAPPYCGGIIAPPANTSIP